jgi:hypothetical protein
MGSLGATGISGPTGLTSAAAATFVNAAILGGSTGPDLVNLKNTGASFTAIGFTGVSGATASSENVVINSTADTFTILTTGMYRITADLAFFAPVFEPLFDQFVWAQIWNATTNTSLRDFSLGTHVVIGKGPTWMPETQLLIVPLNAGDAIQLRYQLFPTASPGTDSHICLGTAYPQNPAIKVPSIPNVGASLTIHRIGDQ